MGLYLSGVNIQKHVVFYKSRTGKLQKIYHGIYADADDDPAAVAALLRTHAARVAHYLLPSARISHASAHTLAPRHNQTLYMTGSKSHQIELPGLTVSVGRELSLQGAANSIDGRFVGNTPVRDSLGAFMVPTSTRAQVLFETIDARDAYKTLTPEEFRDLIDGIKLEKDLDSDDDLVRYLNHIAGTPEMATKVSKIIKVLEGSRLEAPDGAVKFNIFWYRRPIGELIHRGVEWTFEYLPGWVLPLSAAENSQGIRKDLPPFIQNLMPECNIMKAGRTDVDGLERSSRYLGNLSILRQHDSLDVKLLPIDALEGTLDQFTQEQVFAGKILGIPKLDSSFYSRVPLLWGNRTMPRLSGAQIKIPMTLSGEGDLTPAIDTPFTHILKIAPNLQGFSALPAAEWLCMEMARAGGVDTARTAILEMPGGPPAILVERFDVGAQGRHGGAADKRLLIGEDFCSVLDTPVSAKYNSTMEIVADTLMKHSTRKDEDAEMLFRQVIATVVVGNGDLHLKNFSLLKTAAPALDHFEEIRLSPAYDIVHTAAFTNVHDDGLALPMDGKQTDITNADLRKFAKRLGISKERANMLIQQTASGMLYRGLEVFGKLPRAIARHTDVNEKLAAVIEHAIKTCKKLDVSMPSMPNTILKQIDGGGLGADSRGRSSSDGNYRIDRAKKAVKEIM